MPITARKVLRVFTVGLWPSKKIKPQELEAPLQNTNLSLKELLAKNSIYQYYLSRVAGFNDNGRPSLEVVLRNAALSGLFGKDYSNDGNLIFTDLKTNDTLVLDSQGHIYACNNVTI